MDERPTISDIERALQAKRPVGVAPDGAVTLGDQPPPPQQSVYQHIEDTVHTLLEAIQKCARAMPGHDDEHNQGGAYYAGVIKTLADAVAQLSVWPQFNPTNAVDHYKQLAEYEVEKAIEKARGQGRIP